MLHARLEIAQVLDHFQVRCVITEFSPGNEPEQFATKSEFLELPAELVQADSLSTILGLIGLWSERTIH